MCPLTLETLQMLKQKHDENLKDFMTWFYKVRNKITEIDDIEAVSYTHLTLPTNVNV